MTQLELSDSTHSASSSAPSAQSSPAREGTQDGDNNLLIKQTSGPQESTAGRYESYIRELELKINQVCADQPAACEASVNELPF